jgi:glycerol-3-phosphate dehydrogenase
VKGSHIVVPRVHREPHAYILQNADKRIVFVIPYEERFSLIGTTDVAVDDFAAPRISAEETDYLLALANAYLARPLARSDIVWTFSGVRPLYDDGASDPSEITRDYVLRIDRAGGNTGAPALSVFGGKLTTYRKLAEHALAELRAFFPGMKGDWTATKPLPGGDIPEADFPAYEKETARRYAFLPPDVVRGLLRRHGTRTLAILDDVRRAGDVGHHFGQGLTALEIDYLIRQEWASTAEDVLWRRTKTGLRMTDRERNAVANYVERTIAQGSVA